MIFCFLRTLLEQYTEKVYKTFGICQNYLEEWAGMSEMRLAVRW